MSHGLKRTENSEVSALSLDCTIFSVDCGGEKVNA